MKGKYVIIDLWNMGFMLNEEGKINFYDTMDEACTVCGMYELENVWVMQLMYNHIELEAKTSASNVSSITAVAEL